MRSPDYNKIQKACKRILETVKSDPGYASKLLVKAGIIDEKTGALLPPYSQGDTNETN